MPTAPSRRTSALLLACALFSGFAPGAFSQTKPAQTKPKSGGAAAGQIELQPAAPATVQPDPPVQLSPRAAYDNALRPLVLTRNAVSNWSETELAALNTAVLRASDECQARDPRSFTGPALMDLTRLCALGLRWSAIVVATTRFIDDKGNAASPQLADAYAARVDADLHLKSPADGLRDTLAMLAAVPYSPVVGEASSEAIGYLRFSATTDAITVARTRQPSILAAIRAKAKASAVTVGAPKSDPAPFAGPASGPPDPDAISLHELYAQAVALPSLEQLNANPAAAGTDLAELEAALPSTLDPDDSLPISVLRRRYGLLGKPLAGIEGIHFLSAPNRVPDLPAQHAVTALLLFPDWCAQCVTMAQKLPETVYTVAGHSAYMYGLLALTTPQKAVPPASAEGTQGRFAPELAASLLNEHPVVTVPPATLDRMAATDFPYLIVADAHGNVRALELVDADDLQPGSLVDQAVLDVAQRWPQNSAPAGGKPATGTPATPVPAPVVP